MSEVQKIAGPGIMEVYEKALLDNFACEDIPAINSTHDGILLRKCSMPAGSYVSGHEHKHSHWNIVMSGKAVVSLNGESYKVEAGDIFVSDPGVRKGLYIVEDMDWVTVHKNPKNLESNEEIEAEYVQKTEAYYTAMGNQLEGKEKQECLSD